uniref:cGMP-dependent protein kinase n=1 Tax=Haptolina ericina TaxID=156174 RepID=A0A7S3AHP9_9EUKA|eukprot:CAMPEP_0181180672 /NCGR_PEP_ID=MMETSP1096-20121128/6926_1 /TAXON_ID=156174 ORGANISM="Chrysochromulina ericina, Strain CCMP281" /NCGR_SAMPLE_ID=MMETSP1096 /ASSEMBLY_ACC=CAM_ASM_000453 /LENGTH=435 /DNA_ID=CAMNT_0023269119 /DNA_START=182 /DNA_END=1489 /DNA_ORIENTATION=-
MIKDALRHAPIFRFLTAFERESLLEEFEHARFEQGEMIFKQGEAGQSFVLIREGEAKCFVDGQEVAHLKAGQFAGERSLLRGEPRGADVVVVSRVCYAAFLDQTAFEKCLGPIAEVLKRSGHQTRRENLQQLKVLGVGSFGTVKLVKETDTGAVLAMKIISKSRVVELRQQEHIVAEKTILEEIDHPFCVRLVASFKDAQFLYMVLEFCPGGELFSLLAKEDVLSDAHTAFYSASVMLAFEYLHDLNIIYRDLKPENLLLDEKGFVKVCDFGFAKHIKDRTFTLCGTPEYLAPEIIRGKGHAKGVDWWGLGILTFEMLVGLPPYAGNDAVATYKLILGGQLTFPPNLSEHARDFICRLLHPSPVHRLGCLRHGSTDVRLHSFLAQIDSNALLRGKVAPPFPPVIKSAMDTSNFGDFEEDPVVPYVDDGTGWDDHF